MAERKISEKSLENLKRFNQENNAITRESIEISLLQLLEKKDFKKITISELVERAGVSKKGSQSDSTCLRLPSGKNLCPSHAGVSGKIPWKIKRCQLLSSFLLEFSHRLSPFKMDQGWHEDTR